MFYSILHSVSKEFSVSTVLQAQTGYIRLCVFECQESVDHVVLFEDAFCGEGGCFAIGGFNAAGADAAMGACDVDDDVIGTGSNGDDFGDVFTDFFLQL